MTSERLLGCHVSIAGGLDKAIDRAINLDVNTIQIHPSVPQRYNLKPYKDSLEDLFLEKQKESKITHIFFHGIYLINLANPDEMKRKKGIRSLINDLEFAERVKAKGVIFHVGSLKDEPDEETGLKRCAEAVREVVSEANISNTKLLLEVSAGSGKVIGAKTEQLSKIYKYAGSPEEVGFALDTQHMWASGYNWQEDLEEIVQELETNFGIENISAIHLNDSKTELGSNKDRHDNLGEGLIGHDALKAVVSHPKFRDIPFILETPRMKSEEEALIDVKALKDMAK